MGVNLLIGYLIGVIVGLIVGIVFVRIFMFPKINITINKEKLEND